jgi:carboxyl-terminal processing protease
MKKIPPLMIVVALYTFFLTAAFFAGFYTRAVTVERVALALPLPGLPAPCRQAQVASAHSPYPLLTEVRALLETRYINSLPDDRTLERGAARGLVSAVGDPYTVFVEPQAHVLETHSLQGEYGGVGVELRKNEAGEIVLTPFLDSPAAQAGILDGDVLLAVDDTPLTGATTLEEATVLIRGLVGTMVTLRVRRPSGEEMTVTVTRQNFPLPSVTWRIIEEQPSIGLIAISRFSGKTSDELRRAADELQSQGATHFVLDLRNNGGGILEAAVEVAAQFLDGGVVMYETQRDAPEKTYTAPANSGLLASAPLVVLVNHNTASAAEIVAGALLDRGRAPLIGQTTFGKGSVQLLFDLSDGSSLHVTAYLWYTPARRKLDQSGLEPIIVVEPAGDGSDAELARAVEHLLSVP